MAAVCVAACACGGTAGTTESPHRLRMAKTAANELALALKRHPEVTVEVVAEGGSSITSLMDLKAGRTDIAIPVADVAYLAYAGQLEETPQPFDQLRGMGVIDLNTLHLLVAPHVRAKSLRDLKGLHISLGAPGSSTALITERMLQAHGIPPESVRTERIPNAEMLKRLARGDIDAAFSMYNLVSQPATVAMQAGVRLLHVDGPVIENMRTQYPYMKRTLIPSGTYPNQPDAIHTIGVDTIMVCRADLDENLVYRLLDTYFATLPANTPINFDRAPATPIPLHPGAARYYRQRELSR